MTNGAHSAGLRGGEQGQTAGGLPRLMTPQEAAVALGCHPETVRQAVRAGTLAAYRVGAGRGTYRISEAQLACFLLERRVAR